MCPPLHGFTSKRTLETQKQKADKTAALGEKPTFPPLPSRVIDVGPADGSKEPYLLDNVIQSLFVGMNPMQRRFGNYIALSHCWGEVQPLKTSYASYRDRRREIKMSDMPPTFRDAVIVCRALEIRYLWIDSLCIVQDSDEDWEWHCSEMNAIYGQSFLTISAAGSKDSQGGLLMQKVPPDRLWCTFRPSDCPGEIQVAEYINNVPLTDGDIGYTNTRAWCFQETVLPFRVVVFGQSMMGWLCNEMRASQQDGNLGSGLGRGYRMNGMWQKELKPLHWSMLVKNYTKRQLTYERDKLPAFSGLAGVVQALTKDRYLAGLWESNLIDGLLWKVDPSGSAKYPRKYRAPSWSWASIDGEISMNFERCLIGVRKTAGISIDRDKITEMTKIIACKVESKEKGGLGEVTGGYVKISGPLAELVGRDGRYFLRITGTEQTKQEASQETKNTQAWQTFERPVSLHLDVPIEKLGFPLRFLGIKRKEFGKIEGLVIVPSRSRNAFSRVGIASVESYVFGVSRYSDSIITII